MTKMKVRVVDAYVYRKTIEGIEFLILKRAKTKYMSTFGKELQEKLKREKKHGKQQSEN